MELEASNSEATATRPATAADWSANHKLSIDWLDMLDIAVRCDTLLDRRTLAYRRRCKLSRDRRFHRHSAQPC